MIIYNSRLFNNKITTFFPFILFLCKYYNTQIRIKAAWKIKHEKNREKYIEGEIVSNTSSNVIGKNENFHYTHKKEGDTSQIINVKRLRNNESLFFTIFSF